MKTEATSSLQRFFFPREEILKHWYSPVEQFQYSPSEFYTLVESELESRKVPGLELTRMQLSEGGLLSDRREYLRIKRERLVFDICAAPFGTSFFFSFRSVELPLGIKPLELFVVLLGLLFSFIILVKLLGTIYGIFTLLSLIGLAVWFMRNAIRLGLTDLDRTLLQTPVVGPLYEVCFRKETYYRQDTRLMYLTTVNNLTEMLVERVTLSNGIRLIKRYDRKPILGDLYQERPRTAQPDPEEPPIART